MTTVGRAGASLTASAFAPATSMPSQGLAPYSVPALVSLRGAHAVRDHAPGCLHTASSSSSSSSSTFSAGSSSPSASTFQTVSWAATVAGLFGLTKGAGPSRAFATLAARRRLASGRQIRCLAVEAGGAPAAGAVKSAISEIDFRVGAILSAEAHESSDKLIVELIDIGEKEPRQICSGLREYFSPEELVGQRVVVVANLKERKMAGTPSNGMVLCASKTDGEDSRQITFVEPPAEAPVGERVKIDVPNEEHGDPSPPNKVQKKKMFEKVAGDLCTDVNGTVCYKIFPFMTTAGPCTSKLSSGIVS